LINNRDFKSGQADQLNINNNKKEPFLYILAMKLEIDKETISENQDFMKSHRDCFPVHIVQARIETIDSLMGIINGLGLLLIQMENHIKGTEKVLRKKVYL
jgi:hypothetical protein